MKKVLVIFLSVIGLMACNNQTETTESVSNQLTNDELVARGEYLVTTIGCADCHSAKIMTANGPAVDPATNLAGHVDGDLSELVNQDALANWYLFSPSLTAAVGPWGISYSANITSDDSGIGMWTEEQFFRAMREGQYKGLEGTRKLLPPMPWQNFANMTDDDLKAIFAYLKSTPPVRNVIPLATPPN